MPYCIKCGATLTADDDRWNSAPWGLCRECGYESGPGFAGLRPTAALRHARATGAYLVDAIPEEEAPCACDD